MFINSSNRNMELMTIFFYKIHTSGLGVTAPKLWNTGQSKWGGSRTMYAPLLLYRFSAGACKKEVDITKYSSNLTKEKSNFQHLR